MKNSVPPPLIPSYEHHEDLFRLISPEDYESYGIDPRDVPIGTFAAEDHPNFLLSRSGGNAYGLGIIEQNKLTKADYEFIQSIDYQDETDLRSKVTRLNQIYQKLGLLIRFTKTGKPYFLIPINLVAHSLQDVKTKADEIEHLVAEHIRETGLERLDIGVMSSAHDLLVHELRARLSIHRLFLFESLEKIQAWRTRLDLVIFPRNASEYLSEQTLPRTSRKISKQRRLLLYGSYMAGKIHDILEPNGKFVVLAHATTIPNDVDYQVRFKDERELKYFLIFTHIFKTYRKYRPDGLTVTIHPIDFYNYLNRYAYHETHLKQLLREKSPDQASLEEIHQLPYLNHRLPRPVSPDLEKQWEKTFEIYFHTVQLSRKCPQHHLDFWKKKLVLDQPLPEHLVLYIGQPKVPPVTLESLEAEAQRSGMMGCSLSLIAEYRNTFRYVLNVLDILVRIRAKQFPRLSEIELERLRNPFKSKRKRYDGFTVINSLIKRINKLKTSNHMLNPDQIEGNSTPVLEHLSKLSLHGFTDAQLREILLIITGHSTMSRIVVGKLPAKSLKPVTSRASAENFEEIVDMLRFCRLMSMAESAAAMNDAFTGELAGELFDLYQSAVQVATNPQLDWEKLIDLRISELGGVQNKAVREMMKFFNLFEFLNNWREFEQKGDHEKEVLCDYEREKVRHLEDALQLVVISRRFKSDFIGANITSQSYFFRQFLETEFHGTGHLFPGLGIEAGFILLWITVNAAQKRIINFNPMIARIPSNRQPRRITKIRTALTDIPKTMLQPRHIETIRNTLAQNKPAFIFDTGIRLMNNPDTKAVDVSFVDVAENIVQIEELLDRFESQRLRDVSLQDLQDMERLFSELESYRYYVQHSDFGSLAEGLGPALHRGKDERIRSIEKRLKAIFYTQLFVPEEIYDTISVLAAHCPEILKYILPEFHAFGDLVEKWPTRKKQSLGAYVMRSLQKFQALITKDRETFQDRHTFYQLAKREFGPLAEEDIGAKHTQLEILEHLVDRLQEIPSLYRAFTLALLFQDIGKVDQYARRLVSEAVYFTHAEKGAAILQHLNILSRYEQDPNIHDLVLDLIRRHGVIGHVVQGEEPIVALQYIAKAHDPRLVDAFALHSVLAAASVEEGLMTEDLLDLFLHYRRIALHVIKSKSTWKQWLTDVLTEKGQAVLESETTPGELQIFAGGEDGIEAADEAAKASVALRRGRQIGALERLLRLMEVRWIDYPDLQMYLLDIPVNFIYHKRGLKSIGARTFAQQIQRAKEILTSVASLPVADRSKLFRLLDPLEGSFRIYDFHPVNRFLEVGECLKLLFIALSAFEHYFPNTEGGLISFRSLSEEIEKRHGALRNLLREFSFAGGVPSGRTSFFSHPHWGGLRFECNHKIRAMRIGFQDAIQVDHMIQSLTALWDTQKVEEQFYRLLHELQKLPYDTSDYQDRLHQACEKQRYEINNRILKDLQKRLKNTRHFEQLAEIRKTVQAILAEKRLADDQEFLLQEIYDYHCDRLRNDYLDTIYKTIKELESSEQLESYWNEIKYHLLRYREFVGKEYEAFIARMIDDRLARP